VALKNRSSTQKLNQYFLSLFQAGETHTVQEFLDVAFARAGLDPEKYVSFDERYLRPAEVDL